MLETGLAASKISLEALTAAKNEAEAAAERNALHVRHQALRADHNAERAEAKGMQAEEAFSRRCISDIAWAATVRVHPIFGCRAMQKTYLHIGSFCTAVTSKLDSIYVRAGVLHVDQTFLANHTF